MRKINGAWHYEPENLNGLLLCRMMRKAGHRITLTDIRERRDEIMELFYKEYGRGPVPVPPHIAITVRESKGE